jgi:CheY-like chemotaxis protein
VFELFLTTNPPGSGTGLGLSVSYFIVTEDHGGTMSVESCPGAGTRFVIRLPVAGKISRGKGMGENRTLLTIDDEEILMSMGCSIFEELGYSVTATANSAEAVELFRSRPDQLDLVMTDMAMPGMTGVDLSSEILKIRPDIPIILCTGFSQVITEEKARAMGIRAFAMKPLSLTSIAKLVRKALEKKESSLLGFKTHHTSERGEDARCCAKRSHSPTRIDPGFIAGEGSSLSSDPAPCRGAFL